VAAAQESPIRACEALTHGDDIEAWQAGRLLHRGRVSQTLPSMGMFWIVCARTGARKLVDLEASEIIRIAPPSSPGPERPEATPGLITSELFAAAGSPDMTFSRRRSPSCAASRPGFNLPKTTPG
jgi:hypothetical protein